MSSLRTPKKFPWQMCLALLTLVATTGAWWWAIHTPAGMSIKGPAVLGMVSACSALAASLLLWRQSARRSRRALRRAQRYKHYFAVQRRKLSATKLEALKARLLLASTLDTMEVGVEIWDDLDRLVLYNNKINQMRANFLSLDDIGKPFEALVRANLKRQLITAAIGREEEWFAERMAFRGKHKEPLLQELAGNQWIHTYETRTPEGYLVVARVDVTKLVRKGKLLEADNYELAHQSVTDELTGLANRRRFDEALTTEWQRATRSGAPLSLMMVDIDHFKKFNDHYGHLAGDECLRQVAAILNDSVRRAGELVARFGGEEFVILLPGADMAHACETAQQCLARINKNAIPHAASTTAPHVTFSMGIACTLPDSSRTIADLLNAADAAMYRAKSSGRAHFEVADQADWDIDKDTPRSRPVPLS